MEGDGRQSSMVAVKGYGVKDEGRRSEGRQ
jgi:hypothetical protein